MRIIVDGAVVTGSGRTLSAAIDAARRSAPDRLIIEVIADGHPVPVEVLDDPPSEEPFAEEVRITTADPRLLVRETLAEAADRLRAVKAVQTQAAASLHTGRLDQTLQAVSGVLDGWGHVRQALALALASGVIEPGCDEAVRAEAVVNGLVQRLGELKRAIGSQDWSSLGDVLAYDLEEEADRWAAWLVELSATIA